MWNRQPLGGFAGLGRSPCTRIGRRVRHGRGYEDLMVEDMEYALVLEFDDIAGLRGYLEHPAHEEVGARFYGSIAAGYVYDYDMRDETALASMLDGGPA